MSILTTLPRLQIADHCEQQGLEVDAEIREMLEQRFRCKEHIHWLEQQKDQSFAGESSTYEF
jgi:hypothetical protein